MHGPIRCLYVHVRMPAAPNSSDLNDTVGTHVLRYSTVFEKWETCVGG